jgi:hypothetical protein
LRRDDFIDEFPALEFPRKSGHSKKVELHLDNTPTAFLIQGRISSLPVGKDFDVLKDGPTGSIFAVESH